MRARVSDGRVRESCPKTRVDPRVGSLQAEQDADGRRLAHAIAPEEPVDGAAGHAQVEIAHDLTLAVVLGQVVDLDDGGHDFLRSSGAWTWWVCSCRSFQAASSVRRTSGSFAPSRMAS